MPNESIERAARALYEIHGLQAGLNPPWTALNAPQREPYLREARAAIFADVPVKLRKQPPALTTMRKDRTMPNCEGV